MLNQLVKIAISKLEIGRRGAAMVEYALLAGLIAVVAVSTLSTVGTNVSNLFGSISASL